LHFAIILDFLFGGNNLIFDSHAHYDDEAFDADRDEILKEVRESGVKYIIDAGSGIESSKKAIALAERNDFVYAAVGIHPENTGEFDKDSIEVLKALSQNKKVVAIGEIGLDYYYDASSKELQKRVFEEQIKFAMDIGLPIIVHDREAHGDTFDIITRYAGAISGVLHCYSGNIELAKEYIKLGFYIGFTGVITFKNAKKSIDV
jgi:TatD DNase family protein